jgi:hypothetical protein
MLLEVKTVGTTEGVTRRKCKCGGASVVLIMVSFLNLGVVQFVIIYLVEHMI